MQSTKNVKTSPAATSNYRNKGWKNFSKSLIREMKEKETDRRARTLSLLSEHRELAAFRELDTESDGLDNTSTSTPTCAPSPDPPTPEPPCRSRPARDLHSAARYKQSPPSVALSDTTTITRSVSPDCVYVNSQQAYQDVQSPCVSRSCSAVTSVSVGSFTSEDVSSRSLDDYVVDDCYGENQECNHPCPHSPDVRCSLCRLEAKNQEKADFSRHSPVSSQLDVPGTTLHVPGSDDDQQKQVESSWRAGVRRVTGTESDTVLLAWRRKALPAFVKRGLKNKITTRAFKENVSDDLRETSSQTNGRVYDRRTPEEFTQNVIADSYEEMSDNASDDDGRENLSNLRLQEETYTKQEEEDDNEFEVRLKQQALKFEGYLRSQEFNKEIIEENGKETEILIQVHTVFDKSDDKFSKEESTKMHHNPEKNIKDKEMLANEEKTSTGGEDESQNVVVEEQTFTVEEGLDFETEAGEDEEDLEMPETKCAVFESSKNESVVNETPTTVQTAKLDNVSDIDARTYSCSDCNDARRRLKSDNQFKISYKDDQGMLEIPTIPPGDFTLKLHENSVLRCKATPNAGDETNGMSQAPTKISVLPEDGQLEHSCDSEFSPTPIKLHINEYLTFSHMKDMLDELIHIFESNSEFSNCVDRKVLSMLTHHWSAFGVSVDAHCNRSGNSGYSQPASSPSGESRPPGSCDGLSSSQPVPVELKDQTTSLRACLDKARLASLLHGKMGTFPTNAGKFAAKKTYERTVAELEQTMLDYLQVYTRDLAATNSLFDDGSNYAVLQHQEYQENRKCIRRSETFVKKDLHNEPSGVVKRNRILFAPGEEVLNNTMEDNQKCSHDVTANYDHAMAPHSSPTFLVSESRDGKSVANVGDSPPANTDTEAQGDKGTRQSLTRTPEGSTQAGSSDYDSETIDSLSEGKHTAHITYTSSLITQLLDCNSADDGGAQKESTNQAEQDPTDVDFEDILLNLGQPDHAKFNRQEVWSQKESDQSVDVKPGIKRKAPGFNSDDDAFDEFEKSRSLEVHSNDLDPTVVPQEFESQKWAIKVSEAVLKNEEWRGPRTTKIGTGLKNNNAGPRSQRGIFLPLQDDGHQRYCLLPPTGRSNPTKKDKTVINTASCAASLAEDAELFATDSGQAKDKDAKKREPTSNTATPGCDTSSMQNLNSLAVLLLGSDEPTEQLEYKEQPEAASQTPLGSNSKAADMDWVSSENDDSEENNSPRLPSLQSFFKHNREKPQDIFQIEKNSGRLRKSRSPLRRSNNTFSIGSDLWSGLAPKEKDHDLACMDLLDLLSDERKAILHNENPISSSHLVADYKKYTYLPQTTFDDTEPALSPSQLLQITSPVPCPRPELHDEIKSQDEHTFRQYFDKPLTEKVIDSVGEAIFKEASVDDLVTSDKSLVITSNSHELDFSGSQEDIGSLLADNACATYDVCKDLPGQVVVVYESVPDTKSQHICKIPSDGAIEVSKTAESTFDCIEENIDVPVDGVGAHESPPSPFSMSSSLDFTNRKIRQVLERQVFESDHWQKNLTTSSFPVLRGAIGVDLGTTVSEMAHADNKEPGCSFADVSRNEAAAATESASNIHSQSIQPGVQSSEVMESSNEPEGKHTSYQNDVSKIRETPVTDQISLQTRHENSENARNHQQSDALAGDRLREEVEGCMLTVPTTMESPLTEADDVAQIYADIKNGPEVPEIPSRVLTESLENVYHEKGLLQNGWSESTANGGRLLDQQDVNPGNLVTGSAGPMMNLVLDCLHMDMDSIEKIIVKMNSKDQTFIRTNELNTSAEHLGLRVRGCPFKHAVNPPESNHPQQESLLVRGHSIGPCCRSQTRSAKISRTNPTADCILYFCQDAEECLQETDGGLHRLDCTAASSTPNELESHQSNQSDIGVQCDLYRQCSADNDIPQTKKQTNADTEDTENTASQLMAEDAGRLQQLVTSLDTKMTAMESRVTEKMGEVDTKFDRVLSGLDTKLESVSEQMVTLRELYTDQLGRQQSILDSMSAFGENMEIQKMQMGDLQIAVQKIIRPEQDQQPSTRSHDTMRERILELTRQRDAEKIFHRISRQSLRALQQDHDRLRQEYIWATSRRYGCSDGDSGKRAWEHHLDFDLAAVRHHDSNKNHSRVVESSPSSDSRSRCSPTSDSCSRSCLGIRSLGQPRKRCRQCWVRDTPSCSDTGSSQFTSLSDSLSQLPRPRSRRSTSEGPPGPVPVSRSPDLICQSGQRWPGGQPRTRPQVSYTCRSVSELPSGQVSPRKQNKSVSFRV